MTKEKRLVPFYPFLGLTFFFVHLISVNVHNNINPLNIIPTYLTSLIITFGLYIILSFILKSRHKAAFMLFGILFFFFTYGHAVNLLLSFGIRQRIVLLIYFFLLLITVIVALRRKNFILLTLYLNIAGLILISIPLVNIIINIDSLISKPSTVKYETPRKVHLNERPLRDIYLIILDEYARADILNETYGFNNASFLKFLESKNFHVVSKSYSNYTDTIHSLPAMFNYHYTHKKVSDIVKRDSVLVDLISSNATVKFLKNLSYDYIMLDSGYSMTAGSPLADRKIKYEGNREINIIFLNSTILRIFTREIVAEDWRQRHFYNFKQIGNLAKEKSASPRFIFAHFILPHGPFVFKRHGEPVMSFEFKLEYSLFSKYADLYMEQLLYTNTLTKKLIKTILKHSEKEPIILLVSDHGLDPHDPFWENPSSFRVRTSNLIALHIPEVDKSALPEKLSLVNLFPTLFNHYFGTTLEYLEDRAYYDINLDACEDDPDKCIKGLPVGSGEDYKYYYKSIGEFIFKNDSNSTK